MRGLLHQHSSLFGFVASLSIGALVGLGTRSWLAFSLSTLAAACVLPRAFYGFRDARALDESKVLPGSGPPGGRYDGAGIGAHAERIIRTYENIGHLDQSGMPVGPEDLRKLAEEEE
jgi:hypothetical protein